jgi:hypothetical protein
MSETVRMRHRTPQQMVGTGRLISIMPGNASAPGTVVTVSGESLCAADAVMYIGDAQCDATRSVSDTQIECTIPQGVGSRLPVRLRVRSSWATWSAQGDDTLFTYAAPRVDTVVPSMGVVGGGDWVTVSGTGFGPDRASGTFFVFTGFFVDVLLSGVDVESSVDSVCSST